MSTSVLAPTMSNSVSFSSRLVPALLGGVIGLSGGFVLMTATQTSMLTGPAAGALYGVLFGLLFSKNATGPGAGLLWGLGYSLLLWLAAVTGPLVIAASLAPPGEFQTNRDSFPDLVGYVLCYGAPLGLALGFYGLRRSRSASRGAGR